MAGGVDALSTVRDAVAIVCEVDAGMLTGETSLDDLGADSLARVSIAEVIEASVAAASGRKLHIDDDSLGRITRLSELADYVAAPR
jgi:hypothetical protein